MSPKIHLVAFEDRQANFVFVGVPDHRGRYLRTDRSVVLVACPMCKAIKGEPCKHKQGYGGGTHAWRRTRANSIRGVQDDLIEAVEPGEPDLPSDALPTIDWAEIPEIVIRPKIFGSITLIEPRAI